MKQKKIITLILGLLLSYIFVMPIHSQLEPLPKGWGRILTLKPETTSIVRDNTGKIYIGYNLYIIVLDGRTNDTTMSVIDTIKIPNASASSDYPQLAIDKNNNLWIHYLHKSGYVLTQTDTGWKADVYTHNAMYLWDTKLKTLTERPDVYSHRDSNSYQGCTPLTVGEDNVLYFYDGFRRGIVMHDINKNVTKYYKVWEDSLKNTTNYKDVKDEQYNWFLPNSTSMQTSGNCNWNNVVPKRLGLTNIFFSTIIKRYSFEDTASWYKGTEPWGYLPYFYNCIFKYDIDSCVATHKIYDFMDIYGTRGTNENKAEDDPINVELLYYPNKENNIYIIRDKKLPYPGKREILKYNPETDNFDPTDECLILGSKTLKVQCSIPQKDSTGRYIFRSTVDLSGKISYLDYYDSTGKFIKRVRFPVSNLNNNRFIGGIVGDLVFFGGSHAMMGTPGNLVDNPASGLYWFDPNVGLNDISDETESSYVDICINSVYPNPVSNRLNIDILYYPSSISGNDLQVDLYNSIGQKVLDITPLGEYSESRNRFEANIDIPKHLPTGSYIITAVSGNVKRIRGIMIVNK